MKIELLPQSGIFYKANLHCHTNISDGAQSPEEVKELFKSLGYSAVCYTDHEVLISHKELCDDEFIALHGYEVAVKQDITKSTGRFMPVYHFNMIAESPDNLIMPRCFVNNPSMAGQSKEWFAKFAPYNANDTIDKTVYSIEWLNDYLTAVKSAGFLITYNHPQWSIQNCNDYLGLEGLHGIEVINGGCIGVNDCTSIHMEQMLRYGMDVVPVGGDDNHGKSTCGLAWTMIKANELTYDALIEAYRNGDCYASNGPEIHELYIEDGKIIVKSSDAKYIVLCSEGRHTELARNTNEAAFNYVPENFGKYFRIEVRDHNGCYAFSRAYKTADIKL